MRIKLINYAKYESESAAFTVDSVLLEVTGSDLTNFRFPGPQGTPGIHLKAFGHGVFWARRGLVSFSNTYCP